MGTSGVVAHTESVPRKGPFVKTKKPYKPKKSHPWAVANRAFMKVNKARLTKLNITDEKKETIR